MINSTTIFWGISSIVGLIIIVAALAWTNRNR